MADEDLNPGFFPAWGRTGKGLHSQHGVWSVWDLSARLFKSAPHSLPTGQGRETARGLADRDVDPGPGGRPPFCAFAL